MSVSATDCVRERLLAYILPRRPATPEQETALDNAVEVQVDYEAAMGIAGVPGNVAAYSNDGVSMTFVQGRNAPTYSDDTISPVAWSILRNAGLIAYSLPTARKR